MDDDFLLRLYRLARESDRDEFPLAAIGLLRGALDFQSAFWGEGRVQTGGAGATLESACFDGVDPQFVTQWRALDYPGRLIPVAASAPGRALEVRTARFYAAEPERASLYERHRMRSYSFTSDFSPDGARCRWLNLYRSEEDASGAPDDLAWTEWVMPHLGEASRIHRAIHANRVAEPNADILASSARRPSITARQREIATLYAQGWSYKDVARAVRLSPATVRNHLASAYRTFDVHTRRELSTALASTSVSSA